MLIEEVNLFRRFPSLNNISRIEVTLSQFKLWRGFMYTTNDQLQQFNALKRALSEALLCEVFKIC